VKTPTTLYEARDLVQAQRPKLDEAPAVWVSYHRLAAEVFAQVAKVDKDHQHEAQALAGSEIRRAREIEDRITGGR
jgi:hypothetical protein